MDFIFGCWSGSESAVDSRDVTRALSKFFTVQNVPFRIFDIDPTFSVGAASLTRPVDDLAQCVASDQAYAAVGDVVLYAESDGRAATNRTRQEGLSRVAAAVSDPRQLALLNGDFAAAVWDRHTRSLTLVRDHCGNLPLHISQSGAACAFSTLVRPLLQTPWASNDYDEIALAHYLVTLSPGVERTAFRSVRTVQPAARFEVDAHGNARTSKYWLPHPRHDVGTPTSREDAMEIVRQSLVRSVQIRLPKDIPASVMLSGGLDSSSVAGIACAQDPSRTIDAVASVLPVHHESPTADERPYLEAMANSHANLRIHHVVAGDVDCLSGRSLASTWIGAPIADNFHYMFQALTQEAEKLGHRLMLTGDGGDYCISMKPGGAVLTESLFTPDLPLFLQELARFKKATGLSTRDILRYRVLPNMLPSSLRRGWKAVFRKAWAEPYALSGQMSQNNALIAELDNRDIGLFTVSRTTLLAEVQAALGVLDLRNMAPANIMSAVLTPTLSVHRPLLDRDLIETCLEIPARFAVTPKFDRALIRDAAAPFLPSAVSNRMDKGAFSPDYALRLRRVIPRLSETLAAAARNNLYSSIVDTKKVADSLAQLHDRPSSGYEAAVANRVVAPYNLACFLGIEP